MATSLTSPSVKTVKIESCLEWTIEPAEPWLTINQIDDCCWRLTIGDNCDELTKTKEFEITVTIPVTAGLRLVILEVGKLVIDLGDTAVDPQSGTAAVSVDLINPDHHVRALAFDVVGMGDEIWYVPPVRPILTVHLSLPVRLPSRMMVAAEW